MKSGANTNAFLLSLNLSCGSIRPLTTSDLRIRKVSGRHQISTDGKHLIDGVAFGRPFLRRANRPAIRIPPRKRQRLTYDEDGDDDPDYDSQRKVILHAGFEDDEDSEADSNYGGDGGLVSQDESSLDSELNHIREDIGSTDKEYVRSDMNDGKPALTTDRISNPLARLTRRRQPKPAGLGLRAASFSVDESGHPSSQQSNNRLLEMLEGDQQTNDQQLSNPKKRRRLIPGPRKVSRKERPGTTGSVFHNGREGASILGHKSVRFDEAELPTPATVRLGTSEDSADDDDYEGAGSQSWSEETDEEDKSDKENATPGSPKPVSIKVCPKAYLNYR